VVAAQLARCQAAIERQSEALRAGSSINVLMQLARHETSLMAALRMGGAIPMRDLNDRRGLERSAARARAEAKSEGGEEELLS
jgi:hypothetical protein